MPCSGSLFALTRWPCPIQDEIVAVRSLSSQIQCKRNLLFVHELNRNQFHITIEEVLVNARRKKAVSYRYIRARAIVFTQSIRTIHRSTLRLVEQPTMKFIFYILPLLCLLLFTPSFGAPTNEVELTDSRIGIPNFNCVMRCMQPTGIETEDDDVAAAAAARGIFDNYAALYACIKKCSSN